MPTLTLPQPQAAATLSEHARDLRKHFIGASESAAILGVSPFENAADVYHRKVNNVRVETNRLMQIGQLFEPLLLDFAAQELGVTVHKGRRRVHPDAPLQATPDGYIKGQRVLIEAKKVNLFSYLKDPDQWGEPGTDQVPLHYLVQVQHALAVLTASDGQPWDKAYLAVCIGDEDFRLYEIPRNPAIGRKIVAEATRFMTEHVVKEIEPAGEPAHLATFASLNRGTRTFHGVPDRLMRLYEVGKRMRDRGEALIDRAKRLVLQEAGDEFEVFETASRGRFTFKAVTQRRIDTKALRAQAPETADQFTKTIDTRQFRAYPNR